MGFASPTGKSGGYVHFGHNPTFLMESALFFVDLEALGEIVENDDFRRVGFGKSNRIYGFPSKLLVEAELANRLLIPVLEIDPPTHSPHGNGTIFPPTNPRSFAIASHVVRDPYLPGERSWGSFGAFEAMSPNQAQAKRPNVTNANINLEWAGVTARIHRGGKSVRAARRSALLGIMTAAYSNATRGHGTIVNAPAKASQS